MNPEMQPLFDQSNTSEPEEFAATVSAPAPARSDPTSASQVPMLRQGRGPTLAVVAERIADLEAEQGDAELMQRAQEGAGAVAFVHFDPSTAKSNMVEALVHARDLSGVHRGLYVHLLSTKDGRRYSGRIVEGPFYDPDSLKRDSTPIQFIIMNQSQGKALALPEYHARVQIEILGEEVRGVLRGATRRPHPASPVLPYDTALMEEMLHLKGNVLLGLLDQYDDVFVAIEGDNKGVIPRNWLTVGTIGSGKTNTDQVFVEETTRVGYAQVIVDPEGEYIYMDQPSDAEGIAEDLAAFGRKPEGVAILTVYRPPLSKSKRADAKEFSVPFDSLGPEIIAEILELTPAQQIRFTSLYEQACTRLRKDAALIGGGGAKRPLDSDDLDLSRGYLGITLDLLISMLDEELAYYNHKRLHGGRKAGGATTGRRTTARRTASDVETDASQEDDSDPEIPELKIYCHTYQLPPLVGDQPDVVSYSTLRKKLRDLRFTRIFDRKDAFPLDMQALSQPGHVSVIDMSDSRGQDVVNIVVADLLARMYRYKLDLTEEQNTERKVILTIEEAHGFVSRERQDKMEQTLDQLRRIARRGRKRWLALHFVTQSPQHLPAELFELANNKIIHQTTGSENLRVLKAAVGTVNESLWEEVPALGSGRAIIVSSQYPHPIIARIRPAASKRNYMA